MAESRSTGRDALTVGTYRLGAALARATPGPIATATASAIGASMSAAMRERRHMVERHLQRADPSLRGLALRRASQRAFDWYARYWVESFKLPSMSRRTVDRWFSTDGFEQIPDALEHGNGVIIALPHLGGWEWAGRWMTDRGHPLTVVVEALDPPELFEWFARLRADMGMTVVPLGPGAGAAVLRALKDNHVVCLLCDRDLGGGGIEVEFFGERTRLPAGPATLGLRTGAPVFPTGIYFTGQGSGHHAIVRPPLDLTRGPGGLRQDAARVTQDLAHELEWLIRRAPDQWHLFQPNWPSDPGYEESPR